MTAPDPPKHARIRNNVVRNAVSNYLGTGLALGVWFFVTPFMISRLGRTDYGLWVLITPLAAYGAVLNSGIGSAVTKYVAEYRARDDSEGASAIIATSLWIFCAFAVLVMLLGVVFAPLAPHVIRVPAREDHLTSTVVILAALTVAVELPATTAIAALRSVHRFDLINVIGSLAILTMALAIVVVLLLGGGIVAVTATIAPLPVIWQVPAIWALRRSAPDLRFGFRGASFDLVRRLTSFTAALFAIQTASAVKLQTDELVIGVALPVRAVSPYSVARRLSSLPAQLAAQFVIVLMPVASELDAQGDSALLREVFVSGMRCTLGLFAAVAGGLVVFAARFLTVWVGRSFAASADIVLLLTFAGLFEVLLWPATGVLQAMDRHRPLVVFALASAALNLGLSIALIGPLGVRGVAIATIIATAAEALFVVPYATHVLSVGAREILLRVALPSVLPALPMAVVLLALRAAVAPTSIPMIALCGLVGAFVYASCYLVFPASTSERTAALHLISQGRAVARRAHPRRPG
jgi:O-antigen/teichoic acid export membrane protein